MDYDSSMKDLVLFGGAGFVEPILDDTWIFNGRNWQQLSPSSSPPALSNSSMAYDPSSRESILFGGATTGNSGFITTAAATWGFTGSTWREIQPTTSPPARGSASMAYDPAISGIILFGGGASAGSVGQQVLLNDTWTYE
jgi:hypothetical protein